MDVLPQLGKINEDVKKIELDMIDRKILFMLSQNARYPLSKIAKFANISRDSVKYRIKGYEKNNIFKKSVTMVNVSKLGYDSYHIFLRMNNPTSEREQEIIKEIGGMSNVRAILKFFGNYDLEIAVIARDIEEFDKLLDEIRKITKNHVQDQEIMIITKNYHSDSFPKSFLKDVKNSTTIKDKTSFVPDKKDMEIIKIMREDAQMHIIDIAEKANISHDAVSYRLKRLNEKDLISFSPVINYKAIGYNIHAILLRFNNNENEKNIREFFKNNENVLWAVKTIGRFNVIAYICTKDDSKLHETISKLRTEFPEQIAQCEVLLASEEYKYTYAPDCLFEHNGLIV